MMHLLTQLAYFAINKNSLTKIQKIEHEQRKSGNFSLDIKNICVAEVCAGLRFMSGSLHGFEIAAR